MPHLGLRRLRSFVARHPVFSVALLLGTVIALCFALLNPLGSTPDEPYHYAAIQVYATQYSPFVRNQSAVSIASTNDMVRYPSYLYHYLLSFPYRFLHSLGASDHATLVVLRLINVSLGVLAVFLLRRLLLHVTSRRLAHFATGMFTLLPITLLVFSGLNYDAVLLPTTFASLLVLLHLKTVCTVPRIMALLILLEVGLLTQYSFMPIAAVEGATLAVLLVWHGRAGRLHFAVSMHRMALVLCSVALLGLSGLVVERYGVNLITYKSITPACQAVHPLAECLTFPLNLRDYQAAHSGVAATENIVVYAVVEWYKNMARGLLYISSLLFLRYAVFAGVVVAGVASLVYRKLGYNSRMSGVVLLLLTALYIASLLGNDYHIYLRTGQPYAINGRYLLPVIAFLLVPVGANIQCLLTALTTLAKRQAQLSQSTIVDE